MSKENVKLFFRKLQEDAGLQEKVKELYAENPEGVEKDLVKLGGESGYDFNKEEMQHFAEEVTVALQESGELDDSQLEAVSGGLVGFGVLFATIFAGTAMIGGGATVAAVIIDKTSGNN